jgi:hypothetical protein
MAPMPPHVVRPDQPRRARSRSTRRGGPNSVVEEVTTRPISSGLRPELKEECFRLDYLACSIRRNNTNEVSADIGGFKRELQTSAMQTQSELGDRAT